MRRTITVPPQNGSICVPKRNSYGSSDSFLNGICGELACPEGIEPPTHSLEGCCSIQLSYGQKAGLGLTPSPMNVMVGAKGFEPSTLWSQTRCATRLRYAPTAFYSNLTASNNYSRRTLLVPCGLHSPPYPGSSQVILSHPLNQHGALTPMPLACWQRGATSAPRP